jgi:hypothetical protein
MMNLSQTPDERLHMEDLRIDLGGSESVKQFNEVLQNISEYDDLDPELQDIIVKVESLAESHGILGRLVGEHAKDIYSAKKVIQVLGNKVIEQGNTIIQQDVKIMGLTNDVTQLNATVQATVQLFMRERCQQRKLMVVRQLASAYQFRAATILGYGNRPDRRFMVTHGQLRNCKQVDPNLLLLLENNFTSFDANLVGANIEIDVQDIRAIGVGSSHPNCLLAEDGTEFLPTEKHLRDVVDELCLSGEVPQSLRNCAHGLISNIVYCSADPSVQALVGADLLKNSP